MLAPLTAAARLSTLVRHHAISHSSQTKRSPTSHYSLSEIL